MEKSHFQQEIQGHQTHLLLQGWDFADDMMFKIPVQSDNLYIELRRLMKKGTYHIGKQQKAQTSLHICTVSLEP